MNNLRFFVLIMYLLLLRSGFSQEKIESNICITGDIQNEKDFELDISFDQLKTRFVGVEGILAFDIIYGIGFYEQGVNIGFSPFKNSMIIETRQNLFVGFLSFGFISGMSHSYLNFKKNIYYIKPNVLLDLRFFKITYSYAFTNNYSADFFNSGHNLGLRIPIFSTCGFSKFFGENKNLHWGHAHHGLKW
jgi:hypothetical protein